MASFNNVVLLGNLTRDPELRYTPQGTAVCDVGLAINSTYTSKTTGQKVEEVSFIDCTCWGKTAELAAQYLAKGRQVLFHGRLKQDRWEDPQGGKRSKIHVIVERMVFTGAKPQGAGGGAPQEEAPPITDDIPF